MFGSAESAAPPGATKKNGVTLSRLTNPCRKPRLPSLKCPKAKSGAPHQTESGNLMAATGQPCDVASIALTTLFARMTAASGSEAITAWHDFFQEAGLEN